MFSRRSESCPRLARREPTPQAQPPQQPSVPFSTASVRSCTLQDLGPEDKQKVAKLLKQIVDLGQEVQQLKQQRDELAQQAQASSQRHQGLQEENQQLQSEQHLLKKKLAQVLLVLRASQAKIAAFEATQQVAQVVQCAVEVQTDAIDIVDPQLRSSTTSTTHACAIRGGTTPAAPMGATQPGGIAEPVAHADSAAVHNSLAIAPGGPPFLHVAPGAHVNITINHAPELATAPAAAAAAAVPTALAGLHVNAQGNKVLDVADASGPIAASPPGRQDGCNADGVASTLVSHSCASEYSVVLAPSPAVPAVIAIPTTTTAAALGTFGASMAAAGIRPDSALPEVSVGSCSSAIGACCFAPGNSSLTCLPVQQVAEGTEAQGSVLMPKTSRLATPTPPSGHPACGKAAVPRDILVDATMQRFENVPVHEVHVDSCEVLTASPMIVPPCDEVVSVASRLLGWQARHSLNAVDDGQRAATAQPNTSRDPRSGRKVLSFDPAIGQSGAFYFVDVADVAGDPAADVGLTAGAPIQSSRPGGGGVAGNRQHSLPPPLPDVTSNSMPAADRIRVVGPLSTSQPSLFEGEATLRQWSDGREINGYGRLGTSVGAAHQQNPNLHHRQHQQPALEHTAPASPCSSYTTETTTTCTPLLHGVATPPYLSGYNDTSASSSMSLSRMAVALDEVARRQRWDVQPPDGTIHPQEAATLGRAARTAPRFRHGKQFPGHVASLRHGGRCHGDFGNGGAFTADGAGSRHGVRIYNDRHGALGPQIHTLKQGSAGSGAGAAAAGTGVTPAVTVAALASPQLHVSQDIAPQLDVLSTCGSTSNWLGGYGVADRYDDSIVDILSQADEELEYRQLQQQQQQSQNEHRRCQRQQARPQAQRKPSQAAAVPLAAATTLRPRTLAVATAVSPLSKAAPSRLKQAASADAILAANLYEENDVFSVIMEQEARC